MTDLRRNHTVQVPVRAPNLDPDRSSGMPKYMNATTSAPPLGRDASPAPDRSDSMKAIVQDRYGSADVLELRDIPKPQVGAGEVLVRVHAAGLDRGVWHLMEGLPSPSTHASVRPSWQGSLPTSPSNRRQPCLYPAARPCRGFAIRPR